MLLSICVLTYNRQKFLGQLVESILQSQVLTGNQVELIILNNGSSDGTDEFLKKISNLENIKVFHRDFNLRGSAACKELFSYAQGEWIISPGDDDVFILETLTELSTILRKTNDQVSLVPFSALTIDSFGKATPIKFQPTAETINIKLIANLFIKSLYWFPSTCFRRRILENVEFPVTTTVFDWWIWIQGVLQGEVRPVKKEIIKYRVHDLQEQRTYPEAFWALDHLDVFLRVLESRNFRDWITSLNNQEVQLFLDEIVSRESLLDGVGLNLIWLKLGELLRENNSASVEIVIEFLIRKSIDVRFVTQHFGVDLSVPYLKLALLNMNEDLKWDLQIDDRDGLERELYGQLLSKRNLEISNSMTPAEKKVITFYRKIRYWGLIRWLLGK